MGATWTQEVLTAKVVPLLEWSKDLFLGHGYRVDLRYPEKLADGSSRTDLTITTDKNVSLGVCVRLWLTNIVAALIATPQFSYRPHEIPELCALLGELQTLAARCQTRIEMGNAPPTSG